MKSGKSPTGFCVVCHNATGRDLQAQYCFPCNVKTKRLHARVMTKTRAAIRTGVLDVPDEQLCVDCGMAAFCYDHRDLTQPLLVVPVCKGCNIRRGPPNIFAQQEAA